MKLGFSIIPSLLLRAQRRLGLNPTQLAVLLQLADYWWDEGRNPYPSKETLSERLGIGTRQLHAAYGADWYDNLACGLDAGALDRINAAKRQLSKSGYAIDPPHVVAELPFGFWVSLLGKGGRGRVHQALARVSVHGTRRRTRSKSVRKRPVRRSRRRPWSISPRRL